MDSSHGKLADLMSSLEGKETAVDSRATSPGPGPREPQDMADSNKRHTRNRPRTYPYFRYLPYEVESQITRDENFNEILKQIYVAVEAGDFTVGAVHWTRELRNWLGLKFDPTKQERVKLVRLYYELALAPGIDITAAERFSSMFMVLTKRKHYLRPGVDLTLDWRPLFKEWKIFLIPSESGMTQTQNVKRSYKTLAKLCRDDVSGSMLAMEWITSEVARMEEEGADIQLGYESGLSDNDEEMILRSSTANFSEFLSSFLGKVFTLLENLPDASRPRSGSPEENVVNTLPAAFTPLLASLSPDLYDLALNKIADFVGNHVINQARDAMAFICSALSKVDPVKALKRLVPLLIQSIRMEIDENGAASTRNTGTDVLPRDRGLVWSVSMLSMSVVHVGDAVLQHKQELFDIALYMQQKCIGLPTTHISNFIHHLLLNLTGTYTVDYSLYEEDVLARGIRPQDWGMIPDVQDLHIKWHVPNEEEVRFAVDLLKAQGENALNQLSALTTGTSKIKRDGVGKEWSDEVARNLVLIRLLLSGVSVLFDPNTESKTFDADSDPDIEMVDLDTGTSEDQSDSGSDLHLGNSDADEIKPKFLYPAGYLLKLDDDLYYEIHAFRKRVGTVLHEVHQFLVKKQEDDVACFEPLCMAYKSWFIDVGIERSAHVLDRVTRLLSADIHPYKVTGLRKEYPRPLLLRRANVYHLQRLRHNSYPRQKSDLSRQLFIDLAQSSVSAYRDVRRHAQSAGEAALKAIYGARAMVIPLLLSAFESGVRENEFSRIKGAMYSLLFGSLNKTIGRDWRYAPAVIKTYLKASNVDRPSIQRLCATGTIFIMDMGRPLERTAILDPEIVQLIAPGEEMQSMIHKKRARLSAKRAKIETKKAELSDELVDMAKKSHWKQTSRTAAIIMTLGLRFERIASSSMIDLVTRGAVDSHPGLRGLYGGAFIALLSLIESRAIANHSYESYLLDKQHLQAKIEVTTHREDSGWTSEYLSSFARPEAAYYVDHDHPGWLVWDKVLPAYKSNPTIDVEYDETEKDVRVQIGQILDRAWFSSFFEYLKQEPRDAAADRFRVTNAMLLAYTFDLMQSGHTVAQLSDIKALVEEIWAGGSDKHQHRATAEILGALLSSTVDKSIEYRTRIWEYVFPKVQAIFSDGLTPENLTYWNTFLHLVIQGKDPRRSWPLVDWLASFRLDMESNAAFKESSKIKLLQQCITDLGWHFQLEKPIIDDFLQHIDHPYKGVREALGSSLSSLYRTRHYEAYQDVSTLVRSQKEASSLGTRPYEPDAEFIKTIHKTFERLEKWRQERAPGQQTPSSYTSGSKTVLLWLDTTLSSYECTQLLQFFPNLFLEQLLYMMDIREDQELQGLAYHVFRHLPNIPHRIGEDAELIAALIRIGTTSPLWHQRLRVLINMQVIYFRRLFLISHEHQMNLLVCVASMLEDTQLEVRLGASTTLSGMIRCSPVALRSKIVQDFNKRFTKMLIDSPLPKKPKNGISGVSTPNTGTSTPTPEHNKLVLSRHAAVLGLGALVQAFPYKSPPPSWIPSVLTTLANKANNDPGMVGKSVKSILSDFKKTRQDTWQTDLKAFSQEQAEDLDGVLWKSYFA
ncbi:proteasome activator subunit 4, partial [Lecanoromycetidae sp. Uapishka_2]